MMPRSAGFASGLLVLTSSALAVAAPELFEFGAGLYAAPGYAVIDKPSPSTFTLPRSGRQVDVGAFSGVEFGAGAFVEGRLLSLVGLEVGAFYLNSSLGGELEVGGDTADVELDFATVVIPVMLKGFLPLEPITPFVVLGPEFVISTIPLARTEPQGALPVAATSDNDLRLAAGAGVEVRLPIPTVDVRLPLSLRLSYAPGADDALEERVRVLPSDVLIFTTTPRYIVRALIGAGIYF